MQQNRRAGSLATSVAICIAACAGAGSAGAAPVLSTLVSFDGSDGYLSTAPLTFDLQGNLYGTTLFGGSGGEFGDGVVFELSGSDHRTVTRLVAFDGTNGTGPQSGLTADIFGNLYGTTTGGGQGGAGTVYRLSGSGHRTLTTLASFAGTNGADPLAAPALYAPGVPRFPGLPYFAGDLYGATDAGGPSGDGTIYELSGPDHATRTTLFAFSGTDGAHPDSTLVADPSGNLYGTTTSGGIGGFGTVFELSGPQHRALTTLVSFSGPNGSGPRGALTQDAAGNLYGTTEGGGTGFGGTIFELSGARHQVFTTLASFGLNDPNGSEPAAGLLLDTDGNLYGTTTGGAVDFGVANLGTVFKLSADHRTLSALYTFKGQADGDLPQAGLVADLAGNLYGTTSSGGTGGVGTVFELSGTGYVTILDRLSPNH